MVDVGGTWVSLSEKTPADNMLELRVHILKYQQ